MNKAELIDRASAAAGASKKDTGEILNAILSEMAAALSRGDKVTLVGFGTFEVKERAARNGRNPKTGEAITVEASKHASFTAGKALKDSLN